MEVRSSTDVQATTTVRLLMMQIYDVGRMGSRTSTKSHPTVTEGALLTFVISRIDS